MADGHIKEHASPIKTPNQLIVVIVLCFLVLAFGIAMFAELGTGVPWRRTQSSACAPIFLSGTSRPTR